MTNFNIKEKTEEQMLKIKSMIEELELQLSLGKADALDEFEKQKKNLESFLKEITILLNQPEYKERADKVRASFEELMLHLSLGRAETRELLEEQKENLLKALAPLEKFFKGENDKTLLNFADRFKDSVEKLTYIIDISILQFALGKKELKDEFQEKKEEFRKGLNELKVEVEKDLTSADSKFLKIKGQFEEAVKGFIKGTGRY